MRSRQREEQLDELRGMRGMSTGLGAQVTLGDLIVKRAIDQLSVVVRHLFFNRAHRDTTHKAVGVLAKLAARAQKERMSYG